ncbi:MAG: N,N-dimethylformamidase beta subunit family domain-containing protein [Acidimicrobiales bacterium]
MRNRGPLLVGAAVLVVILVAVVVLIGVLGNAPSAGRARKTGGATTSTRAKHPKPAGAPSPGDSTTFLGPYGVGASWVIAENKLPGTTDWQIRDTPKSGSIDGFSSVTYGAIGAKVTLYVSSTAARFHVEAYRMGYYGGKGARLVWRSPEVAAAVQPACPVTPVTNMVSCDNWAPSLTFTVTAAFLPGEYLLKLVGSGNEQSYIVFTVWDPSSHSAYLFKGDVYTEEAWNTYGGYDLYQGLGTCAPTYPPCNRARVVSFDRPMFGNGASDFLGNEYPLLELMEEHGLDVSYADDLTVEQHPSVLLQHKAILSLGHDECWSLTERQAADTAQAAGVNMIFFGASAVLRHVRLQASPLGPDRELVDYRDSSEDPLNGKANPLEVTGNAWFSPPTDWPESGFTGEMYAGYIEPGEPAAPFVVWDASSWLLKGTGLHDGSAIPGVIQADFDHVAASWPMPSNLQVLGHSPVPLSHVQTDLGQWGTDTYSDATYYTTAKSKAGVFDSGDNNWIFSLIPCAGSVKSCPASTMAKLTTNLLWLFGQGPAGRYDPSVGNTEQVTPAGS